MTTKWIGIVRRADGTIKLQYCPGCGSEVDYIDPESPCAYDSERVAYHCGRNDTYHEELPDGTRIR